MRTSEYIKKYNLKSGFIISLHEPFLEDFYFDFQSNVEIQTEIVSEFTETKFWSLVSTFREKFESIFNKCPIPYPEHIWNKFMNDYVPVVLFDFFPQILKDAEKVKDMDYITLYKYIFETLSMGDIIKGNKNYFYVPKPTSNRFDGVFGHHVNGVFSHDEEKWTDSPDKYFLESIIKICKEILDFELFYIERISCEKFLGWTENKHRHVLKKEENNKRHTFDGGFFDFFSFYYNFKKKIEDQVKNIQLLEIKTFFNRLGIEPTKNVDVVKSVYKELAKKYHPDKIGNTKENHERMVEINEAKTKCLLYCKG